jgi:glycosyltransferase involved in cell wall biosynthesis
MRIGFHYHIPAISKNGAIYMPGSLGRFVDAVADLCENVTCFLHSPRTEELDRMDYQVVSQSVYLVDIGPHASVPARMLRSNQYTAFLKDYSTEMDILLVRGPSPLLPAMVASSPVPTALLLVGDYLTGVNDLPQPRWRKEAIRLWSYWNKWGQNRAVHRSITFVNSRILFEELQRGTTQLFEVRTTTLRAEDFFIRADTCQSQPYRLLYAGRMDRGKGLLIMVEAIALLVQNGEDVILDLVGWPEPGDPILEEVEAHAKKRGISDRVRYLGSRPVGPELFVCYREADIFIIASLASEGFPRTIWEAMAHCLPVIATEVGSIPAFVQGAAELVRPRDALALAGAIAQLIHHPENRQKLIERGLTLARSNTLKAQVAPMVTKMQSWLDAQDD